MTCLQRRAFGFCVDRFWDLLRNSDVPFATEWKHLCTLAAEIDHFAPVLLSDAAPHTTATLGSTEPLSWIATRSHWANVSSDADVEKVMYVFVVNDGGGEGVVSFALGGGHTAGSVSVVSESPHRAVDVIQGGFSDSNPRLGVLVYEVKCVAGTS